MLIRCADFPFDKVNVSELIGLNVRPEHYGRLKLCFGNRSDDYCVVVSEADEEALCNWLMARRKKRCST